MRDVVILHDHLGYPKRCRALQAVHPRVYPVTPWDKPHPHTTSIRPPDEWLPIDPSMSYGKKCWWKADSVSLAAAKHLDLKADYFWFIESDVVASPDRWHAMFDDFRNDRSDLVAPGIQYRHERPELFVWSLDTTPAWTTHFIMMAVFRLSRRALLECIKHAETMRNVFSEVTLPSVVHRAGMTMQQLNVRQVHCNNQTFGPQQKGIILNPKLINHPSKANTAGVPA